MAVKTNEDIPRYAECGRLCACPRVAAPSRPNKPVPSISAGATRENAASISLACGLSAMRMPRRSLQPHG